MVRVRSLVAAVGVLFLPFVATSVLAQPAETGPEREIVAAFEYPGRVIEDDSSVDLDLVLKNNGRKDETVFLTVQKTPENWQAQIKQFSDIITGVFLAAGEKKSLDFTADLKDRDEEQRLASGDYEFEVAVSTEDEQLKRVARARITVQPKAEEEQTEEQADEAPVRITTSYPSLRGATDSEFEFSLDVHNETDEDEMFNLRADKPQGWEVAFKPGYENKYIGTFEIKSNLSQSIKVEVKPTPRAEAGEYPIKVVAESAQGQAEIELTVTLTGTHDITCRTLNGVLSLSTRKGQEATMSMYVINEGSALQRQITFNSFKPENWEVSFEPEMIEALEPRDMKQVEIKIKSAPEALVGDYSVTVSAQGQDADHDLELRVTVKASATWGWIGIIVIVVVVVGLGWTFKRLGRR